MKKETKEQKFIRKQRYKAMKQIEKRFLKKVGKALDKSSTS